MPYQNEYASKSSHFDIVRNPQIADFLGACEYLREPSEDEGKAMGAHFEPPPLTQGIPLPEYVIAVDGSLHEDALDPQRFPSTRFGYIKVSTVLIDLTEFGALWIDKGRFVDPFKVAKLRDGTDALTFPLPSANVTWGGKRTVRDSFRAAVDAHLSSPRTRWNEVDPTTSLRTTLFRLASTRPDLGTGDPSKLKIHRCPNEDCGQGPIEVRDIPDQQFCPHCGSEVYPSDCLRVWEEVQEFQPNIQAISRLMLIVEHMLPIHYIRHVREVGLSRQLLSGTAFFVDGPLAVFGNGAWLHGSIMRYLHETNADLQERGNAPVLMIGLQKTGQVVEHMALIDRFVERDRIFSLDDEYRYAYVLGRDAAGNGFGFETYYGQDFIYKTPSGRTFVFALPYPFPNKEQQSGRPFTVVKTDLGNYPDLPRALALIQHFESDLYQNSVVPIALAHRYTAISLSPGGKVLNLLAQKALEGSPER
jgi:hypothetical protein